MKSILIVEDDPLSLEILTDFLSHHGYRIHSATTGPDGVAVFREQGPDLMLVDVQLPHMNGFEVCMAVKQTPEGKATPLLLMSAVYTETEHVRRYQDAGMQAEGYVKKPFELKVLLAQIRSLISQSQSQ